MLTRIFLILLLLIAPAQAQFSKSTIQSQINSQFPDQNTGQITPATTRAFLANLLNSYQQYAGLNKQVGTTYTVAGSDYGQIVTFTNGSTVAVTLTQANSTGFSTFNFFPQNLSTGNVVITPQGGSTICGASVLTLSNTQAAWIVSDGTNYQCVFGFSSSQISLQGVANSLKGNPTGATATIQDVAVPSCSATGSSLQWTTSTGFGCPTQVASFAARTGAVTATAGDYTMPQLFNCVVQPQGRLTFSTTVPVMVSTVSGATSHFYTPYQGQMVPIFDGTRFICTDTGGELTQTAADTAKSPTAVTTNACYDVFVWNDSGTIRATRGKVWTNTTTRADALARINGIFTNGTAVTNGPGINRGTYVGTECSNGTSTFDFIYGAAASGGTAASFNAWNQYNRVEIATNVTDNGASFTMSSSVRQSRASAGNQVTFVSGNVEDGIVVAYTTSCTSGATAGDGCTNGYGLDSTTTFSAQQVGFATATAVATSSELSGTWVIGPQVGRHILSANEQQIGATNNSTFNNGTANVFGFRMRM